MTIDIHTHFIPPEFVADARAGRALDHIALQRRDGADWMVHPQGYTYPLSPEFFDRDAKLREMDSLGIDAAVLSLTPTLFFYWGRGGAPRAPERDARRPRCGGLESVRLWALGLAESLPPKA